MYQVALPNYDDYGHLQGESSSEEGLSSKHLSTSLEPHSVRKGQPLGMPLPYGFTGKGTQGISSKLLSIFMGLQHFVAALRLCGREEGTCYWAGFARLELWGTAGWEINQIKDNVFLHQH